MNVFIGCGSADVKNINPVYVNEAKNIASYLASNGYNLLCGGTDGLMGEVRNIFLEKDRTVTTIWVDDYWDYNKVNTPNSISVPYIKERKFKLFKDANLAIILPGGYGTIDELHNAIESRRAIEHNVATILLNINNYYQGTILQMETMEKEKFGHLHPFEGKEDKLDIFYIAQTTEDAIKHIENLEKKGKIRKLV